MAEILVMKRSETVLQSSLGLEETQQISENSDGKRSDEKRSDWNSSPNDEMATANDVESGSVDSATTGCDANKINPEVEGSSHDELDENRNDPSNCNAQNFTDISKIDDTEQRRRHVESDDHSKSDLTQIEEDSTEEIFRKAAVMCTEASKQLMEMNETQARAKHSPSKFSNIFQPPSSSSLKSLSTTAVFSSFRESAQHYSTGRRSGSSKLSATESETRCFINLSHQNSSCQSDDVQSTINAVSHNSHVPPLEAIPSTAEHQNDLQNDLERLLSSWDDVTLQISQQPIRKAIESHDTSYESWSIPGLIIRQPNPHRIEPLPNYRSVQTNSDQIPGRQRLSRKTLQRVWKAKFKQN